MESPPHDGNELWPAPPQEQPKTAIPKTIGVLNIFFGSVLLLCAICSSLNLVLQSAMGPMMAMQQQQFQQVIKAEQQRKLQELQEREKTAKDEKEKAELRNKQKLLQAQHVPKMPDITKFTQDVRFQGFMIVDIATGFILNILMVISGIGLLGFKQWGRTTAIWVAAIKIFRLVALYTVYALVIVPILVKLFTSMFQEMFDEMAKTAPPGQKLPGPEELAQFGMFMGIMLTVFAVGMIIFGIIYPIIVLILLTRRRVKAACTPPATSA